MKLYNFLFPIGKVNYNIVIKYKTATIIINEEYTGNKLFKKLFYNWRTYQKYCAIRGRILSELFALQDIKVNIKIDIISKSAEGNGISKLLYRDFDSKNHAWEFKNIGVNYYT